MAPKLTKPCCVSAVPDSPRKDGQVWQCSCGEWWVWSARTSTAICVSDLSKENSRLLKRTRRLSRENRLLNEKLEEKEKRTKKKSKRSPK